jgi:hypothetical protein
MQILTHPARTLAIAATIVLAAACNSDHGGTTSPPDYVSLAGEYAGVSDDGETISGDLHMSDTTYVFSFDFGGGVIHRGSAGSYTATRAGFITMSRCGGGTGVYSLSEGVLTLYLPCGSASVETFVWKMK